MKIDEEIRNIATSRAGEPIPKPEAKADFLIKGLGRRRGGEALVYTIPSHTGNVRNEKGVALSEFALAFEQLREAGELTRAWFDAKLPDCAGEGSCNFTTIGGIFQMLGLAEYADRGRYTATGSA